MKVTAAIALSALLLTACGGAEEADPPINGGTYTWDNGVTMSLSIEALEPWGVREDWCGNGRCGITEPDDLRLLLRYEVRVPDDFEGDFNTWACPGQLTVKEGNDEEAIKGYQASDGSTLELSGTISRGSTKYGVEGYAIAKEYADADFLLSSICGANAKELGLEGLIGASQEDLEQRIKDVEDQQKNTERVLFAGKLNATASPDTGTSAAVTAVPTAESLVPSAKELTNLNNAPWGTTLELDWSGGAMPPADVAEPISFGKFGEIEPPSCTGAAFMAVGGVPMNLAAETKDFSIGYTEDDRKITDDRLSSWHVQVLKLEPGRAQEIVSDAAKPIVQCKSSTYAGAGGMRVPLGLIGDIKADGTTTPTAASKIQVLNYGFKPSLVILEALGDALVYTDMWATEPYMGAALDLYNAKMDEAAKAAGISREPLALPVFPS